MDKNVECKFYKYFWFEQYCMQSNLILLNLERTTNSFFKAQNSFELAISAFYPHFNVLSPFQRFIPMHFSVLSPCISAFYPPFQFLFSVSVSAIQFQRFIPTLVRNEFRGIIELLDISQNLLRKRTQMENSGNF